MQYTNGSRNFQLFKYLNEAVEWAKTFKRDTVSIQVRDLGNVITRL